MKQAVHLTRQDFEQLLAEHRHLIQLSNDLEYCLHRLGESDNHAVIECQHAAGTLIARLRQLLFRHDQQVLPVLETWLHDDQL